MELVDGETAVGGKQSVIKRNRKLQPGPARTHEMSHVKGLSQ